MPDLSVAEVWNQQGQLGGGSSWYLPQQMVAGFAGPRQYLLLLLLGQ